MARPIRWASGPGTTMAALAATKTLVALAVTSAAAIANMVVDVGGAKQLLGLEDSLLETISSGVTVEMHTPQLHELGREPLIRPDSPWEIKDIPNLLVKKRGSS